jgi:hypothetical protein
MKHISEVVIIIFSKSKSSRILRSTGNGGCSSLGNSVLEFSPGGCIYFLQIFLKTMYIRALLIFFVTLFFSVFIFLNHGSRRDEGVRYFSIFPSGVGK